MAKVFISYSRKDIEFAKKLTAELQKGSLDFWIDWEGIPPTVDWWREIEKGIEEADIFLFLISPDSAKSKVCGQEIDHAVKNGKRLIPIVVRDINDDEKPAQLGHLNWIFFRENDDFLAASQKLMTAIQTDYEWVAEHRRLQVKALEWERSNHENSYLLRGKDLQEAEFQLATNTSKEPHPTDLQRDYVFKSRQAVDRARRITTGIYAAGIVALAALAVFGFIMAVQANASAREAENQAKAALTAQAKAEEEQAKAQAAQKIAETESRIANTGRLALEAKGALSEFPQRALLLALEAIRINEDAGEPIRSDAEEALRLSMRQVSGIGLPGFKHEVSMLQFSRDNRWLVTGTNVEEGEIKIWNFESLISDPNYQPFYIHFPVTFDESVLWYPQIYPSPQITWLVMDGSEQTQLWKIDVQDENREPLTFQGKVEFSNPKSDLEILEKQADQVVLWDIDPQTLDKVERATFSGVFSALSKDRKYLVTDDPQQGLLLWNLAQPQTPAALLSKTHIADYQMILIDPNNRWLLLFRESPREEIQVPTFNEQGIQSGMEAWMATDIILIPLKKSNVPQEYVINLNINLELYLDYRVPTFSPDGNALAFIGSSSPNPFTGSGEDFGILKLDNQEYSYFVTDRKDQYISALSFINKDWLYLSLGDRNTGNQRNTLLDLRLDDIFSGIDLSTPLFLDSNGNVRFSDDGNSLLMENGERIDFALLDLNHAIVLSPAVEDFSASKQNELLLEMSRNPQSVGLEDTVSITAESADGQWLVAGTRDGSLRLWDNANPWKSSNVTIDKAGNYIALSNDNQWLATGNTLARLENGIPVTSHSLEQQDIPSMAVFSPDSRWLAYICNAAIYDQNAIYDENNPYTPQIQVKLIELDKTAESPGATVIGESADMYSLVQFSADSRWLMLKEERIYTMSGGEKSFVYDLENKKSHMLPYSLANFSFTQDQKHVILFGGGYAEGGSYSLKTPEIWKLPDNSVGRLEKIGEIETADYTVVSQNGRWLLSIPKEDYGILTSQPGKLWDTNCIVEGRACAPFEIPANDAGFSPDSRHLIVGYRAENDFSLPIQFDVWKLSNENQPAAPEKIYSNKSPLIMPTIGKDGDALLFGVQTMNFSNTAGLFTTWGGYNSIGANVTTFDGYGKVILGMGGGAGYIPGSFQKDYKVDAYLLGDNPKNAPEPISLRGHESNISASQISPDGRFILTFSGESRDNGGAPEKLFRLWDLEKLRLDPKTKPVILPLDLGDERSMSSLAFSPDSRRVYILDNTNALYYFPTSIEDLKEQACSAVGRNFIINEWERFFPDKQYRKTCDNLPEHSSAVSQ
jgi:WD40 repeat protein